MPMMSVATLSQPSLPTPGASRVEGLGQVVEGLDVVAMGVHGR
jgi:hypothetical protein